MEMSRTQESKRKSGMQRTFRSKTWGTSRLLSGFRPGKTAGEQGLFVAGVVLVVNTLGSGLVDLADGSAVKGLGGFQVAVVQRGIETLQSGFYTGLYHAVAQVFNGRNFRPFHSGLDVSHRKLHSSSK